MEVPSPDLMKSRRKTLLCIVTFALGTLVLLVVYAQRVIGWEEDAFKGRPLSELESVLARQGRALT
ncbi:MAG TPA: hypothetical protein VJW76_13980, partial [Verrucomicrobiae bacterium]|nr:hypothetical protein [Verrucomicrobiae bacterium]